MAVGDEGSIAREFTPTPTGGRPELISLQVSPQLISKLAPAVTARIGAIRQNVRRT
jgi:hypothetical protein